MVILINHQQYLYKWNKINYIKPTNNIHSLLVKYNDGFKMFIYNNNDIVSNRIKKNGMWKECENLYNLWKKFKFDRKNGYFVDVGANIGTCSLKMLYYGINTISFEPFNDNLFLFTKSLLYNTSFLTNIELYTIGLSNNNRIMPLYINNDRGGSSFYRNWSNNIKESVNINLFALDKIYDHKLNILLLKIDVEGYEYNVLLGAKKLLKNHRIKVVYIEINCYGIKNSGLNEDYIYTILSYYNYTINNKRKCLGVGIFDIYAVYNK